MKSRYNPVLLAIVAIGLVMALYLNFERHEVEQKNNTVELAMEYENLRRLAALEGLPEEKVLLEFKKAGINSLMIFDTTLERLSKKGELNVATAEQLRNASVLGEDAGVFAGVVNSKDFHGSAAYIAPAADMSVFKDTVDDLKIRYGSERVKQISEQPPIVRVDGSTDLVLPDKYDEPLGVLQAPLGLPAKDMRKAAELGFNIIIRPQNYVAVDEEKIDSIFKRVEDAGVKVHAMMPCGREAVGYPDKLDYMSAKLMDADMQLIMLEHYTQLRFADIKGLVSLAEGVGYKASRSYVIDGMEQKKISVDTALRRWALTDEERNIRVNYIRPFHMPVDGKPLLETNLKYVEDIKKSVEERGYTIGKAGIFAESDSHGYYMPYFTQRFELLPVAAAIIAGCVIFLSLLVKLGNGKQLLLWAVLTAGACGLLLFFRGLLLRQMLAMAAACVFPVLSMNVILDIWDSCKSKTSSALKIVFNAVWQLALAIALSLVGAAFLSAILTDSRFLLEIDIYRGVKLTFMLPVILMAVLYAKRYDLLQAAGKGLPAVWSRVNGLLDIKLTYKHIALLLVFLFVAYYFVGRSGHTGGVAVSGIELKLRALLEDAMYARPRNKEFMIGHPAFFLAAMAAYKGAPRLWQFVLVCGAVIGQASLVQTFCHMRTPVVMSFVRALDGYAVGIIFGAVAVLTLAAMIPLIVRLKRRYLEQ